MGIQCATITATGRNPRRGSCTYTVTTAAGAVPQGRSEARRGRGPAPYSYCTGLLLREGVRDCGPSHRGDGISPCQQGRRGGEKFTIGAATSAEGVKKEISG